MRRTASAIPLFEDGTGPAFDAKIRAFAREVAKRHRGRTADTGALVIALRGYHRLWSTFERVPALDERSIAMALSEYEFVRSGRRTTAA